jgi:hypothetical protein
MAGEGFSLRHLSLIAVVLFSFLSSFPAAAGEATTVETTLYFGLDIPGGEKVNEEDWTDFLATVVTPRFPDGFTVIDAYGQWRDPSVANAQIVRETTKVIVIVRPASDEADARVFEIKSLYMTRFGQKSVFHTDAPVRIVE